jgi:hypothetical protein
MREIRDTLSSLRCMSVATGVLSALGEVWTFTGKDASVKGPKCSQQGIVELRALFPRKRDLVKGVERC